ncbi:ADP-ribosylglycohydrolase family protein [Coraliomargarita sp. SDUM461004]|uniref:ADP-ribosylglycohydrolase family protein n=1 Tax=Thalassobacterium sedimentorum TaxID=3041258 RepID=A0ABU1AMN8_9BACT|nr:ADP-ribosylglycohydrolase family protein [Coraliomargarita sp. SDUM461004]MDQ8196066.1 ADP-ribosylglycohydrolase family protein [Coraliomargarita sp. SDUM461004]
MDDIYQRRAGLLFGSFAADALSLGVHWIYDCSELAQKFGYVTEYQAPGVDSYHPTKGAGEQSHVGDQALCLLDDLLQNQGWDAGSFMQNWVRMWPGYRDYLDHATKATLQNLEQGASALRAGSDSKELAGAVRIAPMLAYMAKAPEAEVVTACVEQTLLTHASEASHQAATFLATAGYRILHGMDFVSTVRATAPAWALGEAEQVLGLDSVEAIAQLGQSCPIASALPAVIYLALKHGDDLPKAFSENAMAGGDNCARGLALGLLLGASQGAEAIPLSWRTALVNVERLHQLLELT